MTIVCKDTRNAKVTLKKLGIFRQTYVTGARGIPPVCSVLLFVVDTADVIPVVLRTDPVVYRSMRVLGMAVWLLRAQGK